MTNKMATTYKKQKDQLLLSPWTHREKISIPLDETDFLTRKKGIGVLCKTKHSKSGQEYPTCQMEHNNALQELTGNTIFLSNYESRSINKQIRFPLYSKASVSKGRNTLFISYLIDVFSRTLIEFPDVHLKTNFILSSNKENILSTDEEIRALEKLYTFVKEEEIFDFLSKNPEIISFLRKAFSEIFKEFSDVQLKLEVVLLPEDKKELILYIVTELEPESAIDKLLKLNRTWWYRVSDEIKEKICIDLEYLSVKIPVLPEEKVSMDNKVEALHITHSHSNKVDEFLYGGRFPK
jgi:hypothetical protein